MANVRISSNLVRLPRKFENRSLNSQAQSYPLPPTSPGFPSQQSYPPPPSQPSQPNQSNFPPPPPPLQHQYSESDHVAAYQPTMQSLSLQSPPSYPPEKPSTTYTEQPLSGGYTSAQPSAEGGEPLNSDQSSKMPGGAAASFTGVTATQDDVGTFNGGSYRISHRDTNTILTVQLAKLAPLHAKPGMCFLLLSLVQRFPYPHRFLLPNMRTILEQLILFCLPIFHSHVGKADFGAQILQRRAVD